MEDSIAVATMLSPVIDAIAAASKSSASSSFILSTRKAIK
jgi:hypothetical protein